VTLRQRRCLTTAVVVPAIVIVAGCCESAPTAEQTEAPRGPAEMPLDNAQYSILEMATAHGAFTLEVEVDACADTAAIARQLVEPIKAQYGEVLVYFYDRSGDGELPMRRVQWTEGNGYTEVEY
jgi:hypothetical protein